MQYVLVYLDALSDSDPIAVGPFDDFEHAQAYRESASLVGKYILESAIVPLTDSSVTV